jgi:hypothetical protein
VGLSTELQVVLAALATWRLAHLLAEEDGPGDVVVRLRARLGDSAAGRAMDCFYCLSLWVAAPLALAVARDAGGFVLVWLGCSGAACLLERATAARDPLSHPPGEEP